MSGVLRRQPPSRAVSVLGHALAGRGEGVQCISSDVLHERDLDNLNAALLTEMAERLADIDHSYRAVAEKVGQLYMRADEAGLDQVTAMLDKPMRNASDNQQSLAALLQEVRQVTRHTG